MVIIIKIMKGSVEIKEVSKDIIEVMGTTYYTESYLKSMMSREYSKGLKERRTIHVAEVVLVNEPESNSNL